MKPFLFDTHAHAHFAAYGDETLDIIKRSLAEGVHLNLVGTQIDTSRKAVEIAESFPEGVYASVGLHPIHLTPIWHDPQELGGGTGFKSREETFNTAAYRALAQSKKVIAIGEMGLDYYRLDEVVEKFNGFPELGRRATLEDIKRRQHETFCAGIDLAAELDLSLMVHCREAHADLRAILHEKKKQYPKLRGVIHSFSDGTWDDAQDYLSLGFYLAFNGIITFPPKKSNPKAQEDLWNVVCDMPLDRLLLETDCPYLTPIPHRGERNEPAYVKFVAKKVAELRGITDDEVAERTWENSRNCFGLA